MATVSIGTQTSTASILGTIQSFRTTTRERSVSGISFIVFPHAEMDNLKENQLPVIKNLLVDEGHSVAFSPSIQPIVYQIWT
jgi:hypothetical protein